MFALKARWFSPAITIRDPQGQPTALLLSEDMGWVEIPVMFSEN